MVTEAQRRRLTPTNALSLGAPVGMAVAQVATAFLPLAGVPVTPALASAITTLATFGAAYLFRGGRKGEPN